MRVGIGYDVHRLGTGIPLYIGGIEIPSDSGSIGHSDGDVLIHAICDAILGAASLGDIGKLFPSTDDQFKGIRSTKLLQRVMDKLREKGYKVNNIDATVVLQHPHVAPFIDSIRHMLAEIVDVIPDAVSVKATTTDHLGVIGEGIGIAAYAVATIEGSKYVSPSPLRA